MADSVTVSIFDDITGIASVSRRLSWVRVLTAWRERIDERRGTSSTSSKVSAVSGRNFMAVFLMIYKGARRYTNILYTSCGFVWLRRFFSSVLAWRLGFSSCLVVHRPHHIECLVNIGIAST